MTEKILETELTFRKVKLKEQLEFYQKSMESVDEFATDSLGFSWESFKKVLKLNRLTFGLLGKIFMKNMDDIIVVYEGKMVAGYSIVRSEERYDLGNVFTVPEFQGRGIASIVLAKVLRDCSDKPIRLDVNIKNEVAIHIYEKNGFTEINRTKEYIEKVPFNSQAFPEIYTARLFEPEDMNKLSKLSEVPNIKLIAKAYKKSLKKTKKNSKRMETQVPFVLLKNKEIVGLGRAIWSKMTPHTASILASAVLKEAKESYAPFLSFISKELANYDIEKFVWNVTEKTKSFEESLQPYLSKPVRESIVMERSTEENKLVQS